MPSIKSTSYTYSYAKDINNMALLAFARRPREYSRFVQVVKAPPGRTYDLAQLAGLGMVGELPEGAGVVFDAPVEGNRHVISYSKYGKGFQWTQEAQDDLIWKQLLDQLSGNLGEMMAWRTDLDWGRLLAQGDGTTFKKAPDQLAWFANNHTLLRTGATVNNVGSSAFSDTALQVGFEKFLGAASGSLNYSDEGLPLSIAPTDLIVMPVNYYKAQQLRNQLYGVVGTNPFTGSTSGFEQKNTLNPESGWTNPYEVFVSQTINVLMAQRGGNYQGSWWLMDRKKANMLLIWKQEAKLQQADDFATGNAMFKMTMRYAVGLGLGCYQAAFGSYTP